MFVNAHSCCEKGNHKVAPTNWWELVSVRLPLWLPQVGWARPGDTSDEPTWDSLLAAETRQGDLRLFLKDCPPIPKSSLQVYLGPGARALSARFFLAGACSPPSLSRGLAPLPSPPKTHGPICHSASRRNLWSISGKRRNYSINHPIKSNEPIIYPQSKYKRGFLPLTI